MDKLLGGRCIIESTGIGFFENDDATAFDARVFRHDGGGDEVGEGDAGDKASALVDLEEGFLFVVPLGDAHAAAQHAGIDADIRDGFGKTKGSAPGLAGVTGFWSGLRRSGEGFVTRDLLFGAAFVDGGKSEKAGEAGSGGATVDTGKLEGCEREGKIFGAGDEAAFFRLHEGSGDAGAVEGVEHSGFARGPLVGIAFAGGDK